jgi:hypothetical protein
VPILLLLLSPSLLSQTRVRVEFSPNGDCIVTASGPHGRANVTYPRRTAELRCAVPALSQTPGPEGVMLEVALPPGLGRPSGEFPRLEWRERDGRWVGAAALDGSPAFVRIPPPSGPGRSRGRMLDVIMLAATVLAVAWSVVRGRRT